MNWSKVLKIGLEVLAASVAGLAIYAGIDHSVRHSRKSGNSQQGSTYQPEPSGHFGGPQEQQSAEVPKEENTFTDKVVAVADGLRGATSMCGKLLNFGQSLTQVVDSFNQIFRRDSALPPPNYYGDYCGGEYQCREMGGQIWRRVSPFVIEAVPGGNYSRNTQYPL